MCITLCPLTLTPASLIAPAKLARACDGVRLNKQAGLVACPAKAGAVAFALCNLNRS